MTAGPAGLFSSSICLPPKVIIAIIILTKCIKQSSEFLKFCEQALSIIRHASPGIKLSRKQTDYNPVISKNCVIIKTGD
jgi:hypothetical protein